MSGYITHTCKRVNVRIKQNNDSHQHICTDVDTIIMGTDVDTIVMGTDVDTIIMGTDVNTIVMGT